MSQSRSLRVSAGWRAARWYLWTVLATACVTLLLQRKWFLSQQTVQRNSGDNVPLDTTRRKLRLDANPEYLYVKWLEGLQPLPKSHGPDALSWSNSLALCATMKDENITDVREWLTYYQWLGVDHVFLTDNNSENSAQLVSQLKADFPSDFLTMRMDAAERTQMKTYAWCAEEQRERFNWLAFFDIDEFFVIRDNTDDLKTFLDEFKHHAGVATHWVWVGPNGRATRPASGGVLPYYSLCASHAEATIKTIVNTFFLESVAVHPHNFHYRDNKLAVDENHEPIKPMWKAMPMWKRAGGSDQACNEMLRPQWFPAKCFQTAGAHGVVNTADRVVLFHYATKSLEDFAGKMVRGSGMSKATKGMDYFADISRMQSRAPWCSDALLQASDCCAHLYAPGGNPALAAAISDETDAALGAVLTSKRAKPRKGGTGGKRARNVRSLAQRPSV